MLLKGLYAITDEILTPSDTIIDQCEKALRAGINILQYRDKNSTDEEVESICRDLLELCRSYSVPFVIDDRVILAQKIGSDGLHIGKDDMNFAHARSIFSRGFIGVSCYGSINKALDVQEEGANYVAFGSFFPSPTKPRSGIVSMSVLAKAKANLKIPVCAIGGIGVTNIHEVAAYRPEMISIVSALWEGNIKTNVKQLTQGMSV